MLAGDVGRERAERMSVAKQTVMGENLSSLTHREKHKMETQPDPRLSIKTTHKQLDMNFNCKCYGSV